MSTLNVTIERLTILPHPNADALELAQVGLYRAVVRKGQYETGDYAVYIPEQAVLPAELIEELGLTGRLAGKDKDRVKAVRLRGELSQGIVCRPAAVNIDWDKYRKDVGECERPPVYDWAGEFEFTLNWAEKLGITKWVPPVPVGMAGDVESAPRLLRWIEIENVKRYPDAFKPGENVVVTEKVHGTCCLVTYDAETDTTYVTSKGLGGRNLALKPDLKNLYWRAVMHHGLSTVAMSLARELGARRVGLYGEVYGKGVQDLSYGAEAGRDETLGYALFDIALERDGEVVWLDSAVIRALTLSGNIEGLADVPRVPVLYEGPYNYAFLALQAEGKEHVSGQSLHIREGLVVRAEPNRRSEELGGRAILKFVSEAYLLRNNGTEFE